jgi:adenylate cyclase class 2
MINFEIKIKIENLNDILGLIEKTDAVRKNDMHQTDYYLKTGTHKNKIREIEGGDIQIISYERLEKAGRKESKYNINIITKKDKDKILSENKVLCTVDKIRMLWIYKHTRIHVDKVVGLGSFLELETVIKDISSTEGLAEFKEVLEILQIDPQKAIVGSYSDLLLQNHKNITSSHFTNNFANC